MIYSHYKALRYFKELGIPGPKPWPLLGNIPAVMAIGDQNSAHLKFTNEYGKVFGMFYLSEPVIVVSEFDIVKKILIKDFHAFPNRRLPFKLPLNSLSKAVAIARDQEWKRIRDILTPTFTGNKLRSSFLIVDDITTKLVQSLIDSSQKKEIVNIRKVLGEFTMETMLSVAFGVQMLNSKLIHSAIQIFDRGQLRVLMSILSPTLLKVIRKSPFDFDAKYFQYLDRTARQVIKYRRQSDQPARRDVLQLMMEAESNGKLSDDEIIAQSIVFLLAGYETTANTISFA
ncbi:Cytochrome P450 3A31, partial [Trichoplax sp. H2]